MFHDSITILFRIIASKLLILLPSEFFSSPVSSYSENCKEAALKKGCVNRPTLENPPAAGQALSHPWFIRLIECWHFMLPYFANLRA